MKKDEGIKQNIYIYQYIYTHNSTLIARGKEEWGQVEVGKMGMERDFTLGNEGMMQHANDVF